MITVQNIAVAGVSGPRAKPAYTDKDRLLEVSENLLSRL
jgi:hypothetical protein